MESAEYNIARLIKRGLFFLSLAVALCLIFLPAEKPSLAQAGNSFTTDTSALIDPASSQPVSTGEAKQPSNDCAACHEQIATGFARTVHGKVQDSRSLSCESCHGNGAEHIAGGGDKTKIKNPTKVSTAEASQTCTQCHAQVKEHALWRGSKHESAGLSCLSCHSAHHAQASRANETRFVAAFAEPRTEAKLLKAKTVADTCFQCHSDIRKSQYQRSTHLFRNEDGKHALNCSSCHEPHGSIGPKMMRTASVNETCYQCHAEKRGPFLLEHAPAREDCGTCHKAHGSNNLALLQARANVLCQQCHIQGRHQTVAAQPNTAWVLNRSCLNCHAAVHGSNHPSGTNLQR